MVGDTLVQLDSAGAERYHVDLKVGTIDNTPAADPRGFVYVITEHDILHKVAPDGTLLWSTPIELGTSRVPPIPLKDGSALVCTKFGDIVRVDSQVRVGGTTLLGLGDKGALLSVQHDLNGDAETIYTCSATHLLALDTNCKVKWRYDLMG